MDDLLVGAWASADVDNVAPVTALAVVNGVETPVAGLPEDLRLRSGKVDANPPVDFARRTGEPSVSVVIPTLNEARNISHVLGRLPDEITEVIIVDGHSTDGTVDVARSIRPDARIVHQDRRGKGNALWCGIRVSTGDITVLLDADGSTDPAEIPRFIAALVGGYDFAKGTRFAVGGGSEDITRVRRLGNRALVGLVNAIWGVRYTDLCYGFNAFWTCFARELYAPCDGFEVETLINIKAASSKTLRVVEVPSVELIRRAGVSSLNAHRDGVRVLRTILAEWLRPA
jgi:glycosyltransferase involved in cell wall biosynthesis